MPKKPQETKSPLKNNLYELSSGLALLFAPILLVMAFLVGYHPNEAFPLALGTIIIFFLTAFILASVITQKSMMTKNTITQKRFDLLSYLSLICLVACTIILFLMRS